MTQAQRCRLEELRKALMYTTDNELYKEYCELSAIQQEEYKQAHEPDLQRFFDNYIKGKSWKEINPQDWDYYSDYHKDVYGFRPRTNLGLGIR